MCIEDFHMILDNWLLFHSVMSLFILDNVSFQNSASSYINRGISALINMYRHINRKFDEFGAWSRKKIQLWGDVGRGLYFVGAGRPFTAGVCPEDLVRLFLRKGIEQENSQERQRTYMSKMACQRAAGGQQRFGVFMVWSYPVCW